MSAPFDDFPEFQAERAYPLSDLNRLREAVEGLLATRQDPLFSSGDETLGNLQEQALSFFARITDVGPTVAGIFGGFSYTELDPQADGTFQDRPDGRYGTYGNLAFGNNPAFASNGAKNLPVGAIVYLRPVAFHALWGQLYAFDFPRVKKVTQVSDVTCVSGAIRVTKTDVWVLDLS